MRRRWLLALGALFLLAAVTAPVLISLGADRSEAAFGDNETLGLNQLGSASVAIDVGATTVLIDTSAMAPGDRLQGQIALENNGTLPLRYALQAEFGDGTGELIAALDWRIWPRPSSTPCGSPVGPYLFEGAVTDSRLLGDPALGEDPGDRMIQPASQDVLCVEVALPIDASDVLQGARARVDLTAIAEQATEDLS